MKYKPKANKKKSGWFLAAIFLIMSGVSGAWWSVSAATGINDQISFQGKVVNVNGTNVANGDYDFVFKLYTVSSGGTAAWTETWDSGTAQVTVTDGIFQVNLGTHTDLPGSIDFNTDNIYLGIEFNGDGEMSPRVHFTAAPYAFNAQKVGGLTVTDTTGTLTIPNGETISFGGSFTTSASNDVTLTTSGATTVTLPTTGTLATLAGTETLTNKTIGSTGLTFSGATTDITTTSGEDLTLTAADAGVIVLNDSVTSGALTISGATTDITTGSGESLVIVANGAGTIDLQDATTADSLTLDSGGITLQNSETIGNGTDDIIAFTGTSGADNTDLFLDLDGTSPVLYSNTDARVSVDDFLNVQVSGVSGAAAGDIWYDSSAQKFKVNENGTTKILCNTTDLACSASGGDLQTTYGTDADGSNATISLTSADDSLVFTNPSSSGTDSAFVLQVTQQNTTAAVTVLDLVQSSNAANGVNLTANSIDSETGLAITTNGLTSGSGLSIGSSAAANFTGSLASISLSDGTGASSNTGSLLTLTNSGTANANTTFVIQHNATGTGNLALRVNDVGSDTTPFVIDGSGNVGIGDASPNALLDLDFSQTSGTLLGIAAPAGVTLAGSLTGQSIDLSTNVTATGFSVTGSAITLPAVTNTGSGTYNYRGVDITGNAITQNTGAGTGTFTGVNITNPNITQTTGTVTANGITVVSGDITTGGTQNGIYIDATATPPAAGTLNGILIGGAGAGPGASTANAFTIQQTASFDKILETDSIDITGAGAITGATGVTSSGTITFSGISNDGSEATGILINGSNQLVYREFGTNAFTSTAYANTALSNLSSVAINTSLLPGTDDSIDLGDNTHRFRDLYLGGETVHIGTSTTDEATISYTTSSNLLNFSTDSTSNGDIAFFSDDFYLDKSAGFVGISDVTPDALLDLDFSQTSGTLLGIAAPSGVTLSGTLVGQRVNLATNITATNRSLIGQTIDIPGATNTGAAAYNQIGIEVDAEAASLIQNTGAGTTSFYGVYIYNPGITQTTGTVNAAGLTVATGSITTGGTQTGLGVSATGIGAGTLYGMNISAISGGAGTETALEIGAGWDNYLNTASIDITGAGAITGATGVSTTTVTASSTIAANGGITLASSQTFTASSLSYMDLGSITHGTTAVQGLRLPQAASASPSSPSSGEGYLAWDSSGNQVIYYNGSAWATFSAGSTDLQTAYGNDADGSNTTISLTAADDGLIITNPSSSGNNLSAFTLQVSQLNTTAAITTLDLVQASNAANAVDITANSIDTETGFTVTANALTSGKALSLASSSTAFTGSLANITLSGSNAANTGSLLAIDNTGTANANTSLLINHYATGTDNLAFRVNDVSGDTTPFVIDGTGDIGIGDSSPDATVDIDITRTAGSLFQAEAASSLNMTGDLTGQHLNLAFNVTANGYSVFGIDASLPGGTYSNSGTKYQGGFYTAGSSLVQDTVGGTLYFRGFESDNPDITQTTGTVVATGLYVLTNTITTGGSQYGVQVDAVGVGAGILNGVNISAITAGAGTENAFEIGSGWDNYLNTTSIDITGAGAITGATGITSSGTITFSGISNDGSEATGILINGSNQLVYREFGTNAFTSTAYANTALSNLSSVAINTSLLPGADDSIDLGDNTHRFRDLYLGGETVHIGTSTTDEATISYTTSSNLLNFSTDSTSNGDIAFFSDDLYLDKSSGFVGIGDTTPDNPLEITSTSTQLRLSYTDGSVDGTIGVDSNEYLLIAAGTTSEVNRVQIGAGGAGNSTPDFFGLDVKSDTGDPAGGFEGAMYYNTSDNVFRCYQNTGWTNCIGSGGSSDLQTTYGTDADGSNATISLTSADDSLIFTNPSSSGTDSAFVLQVTQQNTTAAVTVLDLVQSSNAANGVNLTANSIDTETGLAVTANALTSGSALSLASSAAANFTGSLASISLSDGTGASSNTGSLLTLTNSGTANANTTFVIQHNATGTGNLAFRVNDVASDTTPFVIDGTGAVGIGTSAPTSMFELYGAGAADIVSTITSPDTTYDPLLKLRTGSTPAVQFTLGVDNSDSDKFKIYSGDGLGSGDEFVIDSNGVTTIANLNLGNVNFDEDAGIVSWVDMSVTSGAADNTVESYTALIDGQSLLSLYALSDGAGSIDTRRVQLGDGGTGVAQPVLLGLDVRNSTGDPTDGFEGAMYYNTSDNVFRCYQNTGWTNCIGAGGSSDLQTTYGNDADGSNATISLTAADDGLIFTNPTSGGNNLSAFLLQLDQAHTTDAVKALDVVQASNAANAVNITANAIDGETGLAITTNGLTSGKGISVTSSATAFTGNLADVSLTGSNAANTGNVLAVSNTGTANTNTALFVDHRATGTGNLALRVNDESGDTTPFIIDGEGRVGIGTTAISANASTERLLQVGSETKRGNMATYGEVISVGHDRHLALSGITDTFVYDTTGDSDGGRWVDWATTDNLSWYSESLDDGPDDPCDISNDDRCYKKSFPRKAILVVTTSALYIFDAATNDMWMKFNQNSSGYALGVDTNNDPSSVTALNGVIYVGLRGTATTSLYAIDFVNDRMWNYDGTDRSGADTGISGRNAAVTYNVDNNTKLDLAVTGTAANWQNVNDVYATVITHSISAAAIGGTTNTTPGNGKVFVALATDAGVTVINLTAGTLNQYSDVADDDYTAVVISRRGYLYALNTTQDQLERWDTMDTDKASEVAGTYTRRWDETIGTGPALATSAFNIVFPGPDNLEIAERASLTLDSEDVIYVGHSLGLAELHDHTTQAFGWVKYFNSTRQTPMMPVAGINDMVLPMDDTSGTQAQDLAIANTDMAIKGTPTLGVNGVAGQAINFDNTDDYLCSDADQNNTCDVDTAFNMSTVGWTFSIWFRHSTTAPASAADTIFEKCVTATPGKATGCVIAYMTTTGTVVVANDDDATYTRPDEGAASYDLTATSTYTYNDNQWHHLVISRTNANDVDSWIDGNGMNLSNATGNTITLDGSQIVSIGASCVLTVTANCGAATNFWDGQLDDAQFLVGTTTQATLSALQVRRLYNVERPRASKKTITVTDATSATSTSLTDTGESWYVNEFAGLIVEITGSSDTDCVGITRRIIGNTATALTFTPAVPGACTLDTSADFQVDPEALYGGTDSVAGIGITAESPLGEARQMCIGTNSGSDTGGVTCYNHQAGPSIVADVYHSQASQTDDTGTDWTGSNYDEMVAIDLSTRTLLMASEAHLTSITETVRLGQGLDYLANQLYMIRTEIIQDGVTAVGSTAPEVGFTGGADLAENYYSDAPLIAGTVVALDAKQTAYVNATSGTYARDMLGVVATSPGIVLGDPMTNGYPIALVGRVPVLVTNENGQIYAGDRLTSASRSGYAMRATQAGRVLGAALSDASDWTVCEGEDPANINATLCTTVLVFVNLADYYGQPVELAMAERTESVGLATPQNGDETGFDNDGAVVKLATAAPTREERIMAFLKEVRDERAKSLAASSEVFTDRVAASTEIITPKLIVDEIVAKSIKADSIEGLSIYTNRIASLEARYAGLVPEVASTTGDVEVNKEKSWLNLEQFSVGSLAVALDASIMGRLSVSGALTVVDAAEFQGETTFARLASFLGETIFRGPVAFERTPTFGADTAGFATIEKGEQRVRVTFAEPYAKQPIVTASLTRDTSPLLEGADDDLRADIKTLEREFAAQVFSGDVRFLVTEKDVTGFTLLLSEDAPTDLTFSWVAIAVSQPRTVTSESEEQDEVSPVEEIPVVSTPEPILLSPEETELDPETGTTTPETSSDTPVSGATTAAEAI